jgi:tartrate dehydrogenase/decarboxylase/D-malate dehydrogenase
MMLDHLGEFEAAAGILAGIEATLLDKSLCTRDVGGTADTAGAGAAVAEAVAQSQPVNR